jgi:hypothetical protein
MAGFELPEYLGKVKNQHVIDSGDDKPNQQDPAADTAPSNGKPAPQS